MGNDKFINIAVAESSIIIRTGITNVLKKLPGLRPQLIEMASADGNNIGKNKRGHLRAGTGR